MAALQYVKKYTGICLTNATFSNNTKVWYFEMLAILDCFSNFAKNIFN